MISPIITLGLSPQESKLLTWGYGPDALIEVEVKRGPGGKRSKSSQERYLRIRVTDEDGRKFVQELPETELKNIKIQVSEARVVSGNDIAIYVKEHLTADKKKISFRVKELWQ